MRNAACCCFATLLLTAPLFGQVVGPRLGYVWDSGARAIVPVEGIPGAAFLGSAADLSLDIETLAISQRVVLAVAQAGGTAYLFRLTDRELRGPVVFDGAANHVNRVALSPSGTAAALYSASEGALQVVTEVTGQPVVARSTPLADVDRLAISDDGSLVIVIATDGSAAVLAGDALSPLPVAVSGPIASVAFRPRSHDVLIAANGLVTLVRALDSDPRYDPVPTFSANPAALAFSSDGLRFAAAYPDGRIEMSDLSMRDYPAVQCPCRPNGLEALDGDSLFAIRSEARLPLFLFDGPKNRVVFVGRNDQ